MSQEVAAVTAAKYVNEVTVDGVTRYQACVHGCSSEVRDTHHEAIKDARRMLQSATVTAVMKGDMPKLPAAAAYDISGAWIVAKAVRERGEVIAVDYFANPLNRSAKAIESWTGEDADEIIRGAMAGNVVRVESRGLAKPETRDLVAVIAPSSEAAVMMARVKLGSAEEKLIEEMVGRPSSSPLPASTEARMLEDVAEATTEVLQATNRRIVALERDLAEVTAERDAARAAKSSEEAARVAVEMLESQVATLTKERDEDRKALAEAEECNRIGSERILKVVNERDELNKECDRWMARAERLAGIGRRLNQEKNDLEAERDAFALTIARLVSKN